MVTVASVGSVEMVISTSCGAVGTCGGGFGGGWAIGGVGMVIRGAISGGCTCGLLSLLSTPEAAIAMAPPPKRSRATPATAIIIGALLPDRITSVLSSGPVLVLALVQLSPVVPLLLGCIIGRAGGTVTTGTPSRLRNCWSAAAISSTVW